MKNKTMKIIGIGTPIPKAELKHIKGGDVFFGPALGAQAAVCTMLNQQSTEPMGNFQRQEAVQLWEDWHCTDYFEFIYNN